MLHRWLARDATRQDLLSTYFSYATTAAANAITSADAAAFADATAEECNCSPTDNSGLMVAYIMRTVTRAARAHAETARPADIYDDAPADIYATHLATAATAARIAALNRYADWVREAIPWADIAAGLEAQP